MVGDDAEGAPEGSAGDRLGWTDGIVPGDDDILGDSLELAPGGGETLGFQEGEEPGKTLGR